MPVSGVSHRGPAHHTHLHVTPRPGEFYANGNNHVIDAARCAMLAGERANLDQVGKETVSLVPVMTDPVFV